MIISLFFSNIQIKDVNDSYYSNPFNLQVEPLLFDNGVDVKANYNTIKYLENIDDLLFKSYIDINKILGDSNGLYLNDELIKNAYLSDTFKDGDVNFNNDSSRLQIYISDYYKGKTFSSSFIINHIFVFEDTSYEININENVDVIGFLNMPKDFYLYNYNQFESFINSNILINDNGLIDYLKMNPDKFDTISNTSFISVLKSHISYENIDTYINKGDTTLYIYSINLLKYKSEYQSYTINTLLFNMLSVIAIILILSINVYFIETFKKKKVCSFKSFYKVYGVNKSDIVIMTLYVILLFIPPLIATLNLLFGLL